MANGNSVVEFTSQERENSLSYVAAHDQGAWRKPSPNDSNIFNTLQTKEDPIPAVSHSGQVDAHRKSCKQDRMLAVFPSCCPGTPPVYLEIQCKHHGQ